MTPATDSPAALLAWYAAMGVDEAVDDAPVDRFALSQRQAAAPAPAPRSHSEQASGGGPEPAPARAPRSLGERPSAPLRPAPAPVPGADEAAGSARAIAAACTTLDALREALGRFEGCGLSKTATNLVFADGAAGARLMLIGEAPGRDEDLQGLPFVGRSGQLLDRMLAAIGHDRTNSWITNVIPWRPPGNRAPTPAETAICRPFVERQIELVDPAVIVFLGGVSAKELLGTTEGIMRLRGRWRDYPPGSGRWKAMATFHPAYLLRAPAQKRLAWRDLLAVAQALEAAGGNLDV
jgi:DNA polymerase